MSAASSTAPEHRLERLIFFSDAVFAIAITLLVIELHPPELAHRATDIAFINATLALLPNFFGFIISFFVIGAFWAGHHRGFALAAHWSDRLLFPNIMLLFAIAAMPFFTAYVSEYGNTRVPVVLYCGWLLLTAQFNRRLQRLATSAPVVDSAIGAREIALIRRRGDATALGAATAVVVGLVSPVPVLAQVSLMSIPLWRLILNRWAPVETA